MKKSFSYLLVSILLIYFACNLFTQKKVENDLIESGNVIHSKIIELPANCIHSSRMGNYCKVQIQNGNQYKLLLINNECDDLVIGDSIAILQKDETSKIIRYDQDLHKSSFEFVIILFIFGMLFLLLSVYTFVQRK